MCTAINFNGYFGRNLDLDVEFENKVVITPKGYEFKLKNNQRIINKQNIIGMAIVIENYPLYFDAMNESGIFIAGLNFDGFAKYFDHKKNKLNLAQFELIPFLLSETKNLEDVKKILKELNITNDWFNKKLPCAPLHWLVGFKNKSIVIEQTKDGLRFYDNNLNVLSNNPTFDFHMLNMSQYKNLSIKNPPNNLTNIDLNSYSEGMGMVGLPGDWSSVSRFIKAAFLVSNTVDEKTEIDNVTNFFHILGSVFQIKGNAITKTKKFETTFYTSCMSSKTKTYYYKTYNNSQINAIDLSKVNDQKNLTIFDLNKKQNINYQN